MVGCSEGVEVDPEFGEVESVLLFDFDDQLVLSFQALVVLHEAGDDIFALLQFLPAGGKLIRVLLGSEVVLHVAVPEVVDDIIVGR